MKVSEIKGFFTTRIDLGKFFEKEDSEVWIELREPTEDEIMKASGKDADRNVENLKKMWKSCVVDHNLYNDDDTKLTDKEVCEILSKKGWCVVHIVNEWNKQIPLVMEKNSV